jgi:flagellar motor switch protein FliG
MTLQEILDAIDHLSADELEQVKAHVLNRTTQPTDQLEARLRQFVDDFWQDTPPSEQAEIVDAIRIKNLPSEKGL